MLTYTKMAKKTTASEQIATNATTKSTIATTTIKTTAFNNKQIKSTKRRIKMNTTTTTTSVMASAEKITPQQQIITLNNLHLAKTHTATTVDAHTASTACATRRSSNTGWSLLAMVVTLMLLHTQAADARAAESAATASAAAATSASLLAGNAGLLLNGSGSAATALRSSIESNSIQRQFELMDVASVGSSSSSTGANGGSGGGGDHSRSLKRVYLSNRNITCNDGSQAGFYLRKNPNSKKWIVFLEGGWHCYDTKSCRARWLRLRHLMTSAQWPETRDVGGILSPLADENPYWHNANHVLVPYCSSDSWSGTRATPETLDSWRFMGALILRQVVADLIPLGLGRTTNGGAELLLVGSSAGALGVMLNLDRINDFLLHERNLAVTVRGVSDSGWFLDREPYTPAAVGSSESVRQGWRLWQGLLPEECVKQHAAEPWRCYFGYRLYPTLKVPLFVFQWLFDEAQMRADNVGAPVTPQQWNYIHEMGGAFRSSLDNVTAVFAPSCISHAVLSKRDWVNIKIDDISLPEALRCWEHSTRPRRKRHDKLKRSTEATTLQQQRQHERRRHQHRNNRNQRKQHNNDPQQKQQQQQLTQQHHRRNGHKENSVAPPDNGESKKTHRNHRLTKLQREERRRQRHEQQQRRREQRRNRRNRKRNQVANASADAAAAAAAAAVNANELPPPKERNNNKRNNNKHDNNNKRMRQGSRQNARRRNNQQQQQRNQLDSENPMAIEPQQEQPMSPTSPSTASSSSSSAQSSAIATSSSSSSSSLSSQTNTSTNRGRARIPRVPKRCALRLLERCSWPQCNHSCPTLTNPLTGEEMRFLELLTSFGLDIVAVAAALGVDMHTLNNMDRTELVNLLTQQVS